MTEREEKWNAFVEYDIRENNSLIVNQYEEIQNIMENPLKYKATVDGYLYGVLKNATLHSEFYKPFDKFKSLQDFPIVNKEILKQNWDKVIIQEYKERTDNKEKHTSGSTGTPFRVIWDHRKHCRMISDAKYWAKLGGCESHERVVCLVVEKKKHYVPMEKQERDNVYTINCGYFDDDSIGKLLLEIQKYNPKCIIGYSSMWDAVANYIYEGKAGICNMELYSIMAEAEGLKERTREILSNYFKCPVYSRYGNEECGSMAQEDGSGNGHILNTASYHFEILKMDKDEPAEDGEIGRVVITDLFNYAFPIIRYENGDLAIRETLTDGHIYLKDVVGRKVDMLYTTDGKMVNWLRGLIFLKDFDDIKQFQIIQEDYTHFVWILNTKNHSYEDMIIKESKEVFGENAEFKFEYVDEIPKLASGKTQMTVCKIKEN